MSADRKSEERLSTVMMAALGCMPITCRSYDGVTYHLPLGSPSGGTLKALARRELARYDEPSKSWVRTSMGAAVWEAR